MFGKGRAQQDQQLLIQTDVAGIPQPVLTLSNTLKFKQI